MNTFKKIIVLVVLSTIVFSCSSDDASDYQPRTNLLLKTTDDDGLISTYTYDSNNRLVNYTLNGNAFNPARNQNFTYNPDGTLQKITQASGGALVIEYFYDSEKRVIKKEGGNDRYLYTYNGTTVTEDYRAIDTNTGFRQVYTYVNGNITEEKIYNNTSVANPSGTYSGVINFTYDDKNKASGSFPDAFLFPSSVNNIKTIQYNGGGVGTSTYEYNADNYPVKRTDSFIRIYEYRQL